MKRKDPYWIPATILGCLICCGCPSPGGDQTVPGGGSTEKSIRIVELIWETTGGGEIKFTVKPNGSDYDVHVESFEFAKKSVDLPLTSRSGEAYSIVRSIFSGERDLSGDASTPAGPTGTWTSITLVKDNGDRKKYDQLQASSGELRVLYDFAAQGAK